MTTEVVKTIRASGGDYTSLSAWVTGEERDLVAADEIAVAEFYDDWASGLADQADLVSANWTVDATRHIKWTVASGHRHNGTPQSGFFIEEFSNFDLLFDNDVDHTVIEWLDFTNTASSGNGLQTTGSTDALIDKCIGDSGGNTFNCAGSCCIRNTLAHGGDGNSTGFVGQNFNPDHYFYNCTAEGHDTGFNGFSGTIYKNCVAFGCTTDYGSTFSASSSHNASDDTTASNIPGSDSVAGVVSGDFVDSANGDFHLATGSALEDAGTDLSGDTNWPFSDDIDGDTRSGSWDIGFDEIAGGGGASAQGGSESTVQAAPVGDGQKSVSAGSADTVAVAAQAGGQKAVSSGSTASVNVGPQGGGEKAASAGSVDSVSVAADGGGSKQSDDGATATTFVAGSGAGAKLSTDGASSTVSVSPQGDGEKSGQGSATSTVQVSADGGGQVAQENAGGSLASVSVSADGGGIKVAQSGSEATSEVTAVGAGTKEAQDGSTSTVTVSATGGGSGAGPDPKAQVFIAADDRETINAMRENDSIPAAKDPDVFSRGDCVPQEKAA